MLDVLRRIKGTPCIRSLTEQSEYVDEGIEWRDDFFFNAIVSHYQVGEVAFETLCVVGVLCTSESVYKVAKVQEFTRSKSRGIKIKNSRSYQPSRNGAAYI